MDEAARAHEERRVMAGSTAASVVAAAAFAAGLVLLPRFFVFPTAVADRLAFALVCAAFVIIWVVIAVGVVSHKRRKSAADIRGSAYAPPSSAIAVWVAVLQNTLEQAFITVGAMVAFAALVGGPWLAALPIAVVLFAVGRGDFIRSYPRGAGGRAFGMALTMLPAIAGYAAVLVLLLARIL